MAELLRVLFPLIMVGVVLIAVHWTVGADKREADRDHVREHRRFLSDLERVMDDK